MSRIGVWCGIAAISFLASSGVANAFDSGLRQGLRTDRIHIRLTDQAGVDEKVRSRAELLVTAVFRKARIELDFVDASGPADYWVQILKQRPRNLHGDSTGFAVLVSSDRRSDSYAAVSMPMVEDTAREMEEPVADVLAASLAHELGHLLLHSSGHTRSGVMKARLDRSQIELLERGELLFSRAEMERLVQRASR